MIRYAGILSDDVVNGENVCVSYWTQGCPHRCPECHNPQTHDFEGGLTASEDAILGRIKYLITKNGIRRNFSILGGEPLCPENIEFVDFLISQIRKEFPTIKIYLWTGYILDNIKEDPLVKSILNNIDVLIDGPFLLAKKDIRLPLRGSTNQRILYKGKDF